MREIDGAVEAAFETFKQHLMDTFGARITNEVRLRDVFLGELESLVRGALDADAESGCCVDELYGDVIFECIEVPEEEEDEDLYEEDCA